MPSQNPNVTGPMTPRADTTLMGCGWAWIWFWLFIVLIAFSGWGWGGWWGGWGGPWGAWEGRPRSSYPQASAPQAMEPRSPATTTNEFLGRTVTVSGKVDQVLGKRAFTLASGDGGQQLLVIRKNEQTPEVKKGETVQVTGKVERYDRNNLNKETGAELNRVPADEFSGRPAVVASAVSPSSPSS